MTTVTYDYDPNTTVWVIDGITENNKTVPAVREGTVIRVNIAALVTVTKITYDIELKDTNGTHNFKTADVFSTLSAALTEYQARLS